MTLTDDVVERAIADALKPYNDQISRGPNAHEWIARRCASEAARAALEAARHGEMRDVLGSILPAFNQLPSDVQSIYLEPYLYARAILSTLGDPTDIGASHEA